MMHDKLDQNTYKNWREKSATKKQYKEIAVIDSDEVYADGYAAFWAGVSPDQCGYLNREGDNIRQVPDWMVGWSVAYREYAESGSTPAWSDSYGDVLHYGKDSEKIRDIKEFERIKKRYNLK